MGSKNSREKKEKCRIISLNMQLSTDNRWLSIISRIVQDFSHFILCLQEADHDIIIKLKNYFYLDLFRYNKTRKTCVLTSFSLPSDFIIDSIHLNDIPSPLHLLNDIYYEGHSFNDYNLSYDQIRIWAEKSRIPDLQKYVKKHASYTRSIIAGDFNETNEWPTASFMKKHNYKDLGREIDHPTWPVFPFYQGEPPQRIDFIYGRGVTLIQSFQYYEEKNWPSDHVAVISDILL